MVTLARVTPVTEGRGARARGHGGPPAGRVLRRTGPRTTPATIVAAARAALSAHDGQFRRSGEPYITHPIAVATIVAELGLDAQTVAAALLHDAVEDTGLTLESITEAFGPGVAKVVDGVTKLDRLQFDSKEAQQAATIRKMLVAMADDWRVLLIKLADRLHNMRTLAVMPEWKQRRTAQETFDVYAPAGPPPGRAAGALAARGPGLRHPAPQALRRDRADGGRPGAPSARSISPGCCVHVRERLERHGRGGRRHRPPEAPVEHLREDGGAGQGVRRHQRPGGHPGRGRPARRTAGPPWAPSTPSGPRCRAASRTTSTRPSSTCTSRCTPR